MTIYRIDVDSTKSMEDVAVWLALSSSSVLNEMFPDQWRQAMTMLAQRINDMVGHEHQGGPVVVVEEEEGG